VAHGNPMDIPQTYCCGVVAQNHWTLSEEFCWLKTGALKIVVFLMTCKTFNIPE